MKALRLMVIKLWAELKFSKCRSKVTFTCSKYMLPSERSFHQEHTCKIWKSGQTGRRTDRRRAKWSPSGPLLRWRHNNICGGHFSIGVIFLYPTRWIKTPRVFILRVGLIILRLGVIFLRRIMTGSHFST